MAAVTGTSPTPNPDAMKFTLDAPFEGMVNARAAHEAEADAMTAALFQVPGVAAVFRTADFVTVTREPGADWDGIVAAVEATVAAHR
jgi:Scaffold protein Nfu/NifU N terminal